MGVVPHDNEHGEQGRLAHGVNVDNTGLADEHTRLTDGQIRPSDVKADGNDDALVGTKPRTASRARKAVIMTVCLVLQFFAVGNGYGMSVMYVEIVRVFESPRSQAALIQSVYLGVMTSGGIVFAWLVNHVGPGPCVIGGAIVTFVGFVISGFGVNVPMIIVFIGFMGAIGMSLCYLGSFITVSWVFHENPGVALVFLTVGSSIGQLAMPYIQEVLITEYEWYGAFWIMGATSLNCVVCGLVIHGSRAFYHRGLTADTDQTISERLCDRTLITDPVLLMTLFNVLLLAITGPIESWFLVDIMVIRGYERETGSLFTSLTGFSNFLGRGMGAILHLFCRIPTVYHWVYLAPLCALSHLLILKFFDYWPLFGACLLYGTAFGVTVAQEPAIMFEAAGLERYPKGIALLNSMYGLGSFIGGFMGGVIKDQLGSYDTLFWIAIGASLYVGVATFGIIYGMRRAGTLHKHKPKPTEPSAMRYTVGKSDIRPAATLDGNVTTADVTEAELLAAERQPLLHGEYAH